MTAVEPSVCTSNQEFIIKSQRLERYALFQTQQGCQALVEVKYYQRARCRQKPCDLDL